MYTVGSWFPHLMNLAILAIVAVAVLGAMFYYRNKYAKEARGKIMAEIRMPSGWDHCEIVRPFPDGWVRIGKGDYKLAPEVADKIKEGNPRPFTIPSKRWAMYPMRPFLGLRWLQVPIRKETWYYGDPNPVMWPENQMKLTAVDAQAHTREMDAMKIGVAVQEAEGRQKAMLDAFSRIPDKVVLYVMLGGTILAVVITLVQIFTIKGS